MLSIQLHLCIVQETNYCQLYYDLCLVCAVIECEQLEGIANGRVELTGTTVGSRATYSCDSGYLLVGDVSRTCQSSGTWSGNEPFCKSEPQAVLFASFNFN